MLSIHSPANVENSSVASISESLELVTPVESVQTDEPNVALAPEEVAALSSLMQRYDQLLVEMDTLNARLEEMLQLESPPRT